MVELEENTMIYGYARVSTQGQDLNVQIEALKEAGAVEIYSEKFTGTTKERPQFKEVLSKLQSGDILIVTKVDRFARSAVDGITLVKDLLEKGVKVNILNMGLIDNTPQGKLIFTIFSAFAEFERDMIVERTQEGKAIAKTKEGFKEGRPRKHTKEKLDHAFELLTQGNSFKQVELKTGINRRTLHREKARRKALEVATQLEKIK